MRIFDMFSGIGGFHLGLSRAIPNLECVGFSEIDKYAISVYQKHFPEVKNYGNATEINTGELPDFDILCAGVPCQAWSIAGKRKGFEDARGTLWYEVFRIAKDKQPKYLFLENVKGLLSSKTFINKDYATELLYEEIQSGTKWEKEFSPIENWIIFFENIRSYLREILPEICISKNLQLDTSSDTNSASNLGKLEREVEVGLRKRLIFLLTKIKPIMKKPNFLKEGRMQALESQGVDLDSVLRRLSSTGNLSMLDINILDGMMDIFVNTEWLQNRNLKESLKQTRLFTTSTSINLTTDQKIFGYAQEASIIAFILKQMTFSSNLWNWVILNLKTEGMCYVKAFNLIVKELAELGYTLEYSVLNSKNFGVPQNRERVFIIGHLGGKSRRQVFPIGQVGEEPDGERYSVSGEISAERSVASTDTYIKQMDIQTKVTVRKHPVDIEKLKTILREQKKEKGLSNSEISKLTGKPITLVEHWFRNDSCFSIPDADIWEKLKEILGITTKYFDKQITEFEERDGCYDKANRTYDADGISPTLTGTDKGLKILQLNNPTHSNNRIYGDDGISPALNTAQGGNRQPKIQVIGNIYPESNHEAGNIYDKDGISPTIKCNGPRPSSKTIAPKIIIPVLTPDRPDKCQNGRRFKEDGEPMFTLFAGSLQRMSHQSTSSKEELQDMWETPKRIRILRETLSTFQEMGESSTCERKSAFPNCRIRRLTPTEAERLQGYPDSWTEFGKDGERISDTQRYKMLGNAVTTNVIEEIGRRMSE